MRYLVILLIALALAGSASAQIAYSLEQSINEARTAGGFATRLPENHLRFAAHLCLARADVCADASVWHSVLTQAGYNAGGSYGVYGEGTEEQVLAAWQANRFIRAAVFETNSYSTWVHIGCYADGLRHFCFMATPFNPDSDWIIYPTLTPTPFAVPTLQTRPLVTNTPTPNVCRAYICIEVSNDAELMALIWAGRLRGLSGVTWRRTGE